MLTKTDKVEIGRKIAEVLLDYEVSSGSHETYRNIKEIFRSLDIDTPEAFRAMALAAGHPEPVRKFATSCGWHLSVDCDCNINGEMPAIEGKCAYCMNKAETLR